MKRQIVQGLIAAMFFAATFILIGRSGHVETSLQVSGEAERALHPGLRTDFSEPNEAAYAYEAEKWLNDLRAFPASSIP
ncbi:MAG TPA: hypothetical protein VKS81_00140, partial [Bacteroidota bacterium]|nr:hypothetical protein [Bacteroidota bacterium]